MALVVTSVATGGLSKTIFWSTGAHRTNNSSRWPLLYDRLRPPSTSSPHLQGVVSEHEPKPRHHLCRGATWKHHAVSHRVSVKVLSCCTRPTAWRSPQLPVWTFQASRVGLSVHTAFVVVRRTSCVGVLATMRGYNQSNKIGCKSLLGIYVTIFYTRINVVDGSEDHERICPIVFL